MVLNSMDLLKVFFITYTILSQSSLTVICAAFTTAQPTRSTVPVFFIDDDEITDSLPVSNCCNVDNREKAVPTMPADYW